jgi:hypothetical protein
MAKTENSGKVDSPSKGWDNGPKLPAANYDRHLAQLRSDFLIQSCLGTERIQAFIRAVKSCDAFFHRVYLAFGMIDDECEPTH